MTHDAESIDARSPTPVRAPCSSGVAWRASASIRVMRAVLLEVPEALLEARRRTGADKADEVWDGVLHMVPPASGPHRELGSELHLVLGPLARRRGLGSRYETGLFRTADDYRVPDQLYARPEQFSQRGAEGALLVVEIRSPDDETYRKIDWYAERGVVELLVLHPADRRFELLRNVGGRLLPVTTDEGGGARSEVLGVRFVARDGRLHVTWEDGAAQL